MTTTSSTFIDRSSAILAHLEETGQLKQLQTIESPMGPRISIRGRGQVDCFCSNNYLGLANHPDVVEAGIQGLRTFGAGTSSVRFICGTFSPHEALEERIASFLGVEASYTFVSCWNATEATFPTLCQDGDVIVSDELRDILDEHREEDHVVVDLKILDSTYQCKLRSYSQSHGSIKILLQLPQMDFSKIMTADKFDCCICGKNIEFASQFEYVNDAGNAILMLEKPSEDIDNGTRVL